MKSLARTRFRAGEGRAHWAAEAMATTEEKALLLLTGQGGVAAAGQPKAPQERNAAAAIGDMPAATFNLRDALASWLHYR